MSSLLLSIISSALLAISFKVLDILKINSFQAIVTNYFVAATIGYLTSPIIININSIAYQSWFGLAFMLGFVFIFILSIIAVTTQKMGITVAGVANKMSIVIPVSVAIIFYKDSVTIFKIIGLLTAIIAVILTSKKKNTSVEKKINKADYIFPLLIFIGSGFIDSSINYAQRMYLTQETFSIFLSVIFCSAGSVGIILLVYRYLIKKESLQIKAITAGIIIGLINYFSMYFVIDCLNTKLFEPSVFFPINNMGILAVSALSAYLIFKEKLSFINWAGIILSVLAITLIAFS